MKLKIKNVKTKNTEKRPGWAGQHTFAGAKAVMVNCYRPSGARAQISATSKAASGPELRRSGVPATCGLQRHADPARRNRAPHTCGAKEPMKLDWGWRCRKSQRTRFPG